MTIEKKSLISALKTTKKANAVKEDISGNSTTTSPAQKMPNVKKLTIRSTSVKKLVSKG
jgi:hypothetical protein